MTNGKGALIGAVAGFAVQAIRYVGAQPGSGVDWAGMLGASAAGALLGAIAGAVTALIIRAVKGSGNARDGGN